MGFRVLSLFDGIACGMQAFKELRTPIDIYYASEIDKNVIKVATNNYPEIIEIGDVTQIDFKEYVGKVDIIIGKDIRRLTAEGEEIMQGLPIGYTACVGEGG